MELRNKMKVEGKKIKYKQINSKYNKIKLRYKLMRYHENE